MKHPILLALAVGLAAPALPAAAAELSTPLESCTSAGCGGTVLYGRINKSDRCCGFDNKSMPWVAQLYANANECLRLQVTKTATEVNLFALTTGVKRAFRSSGKPPVLRIKTTNDEAGFHLVQVSGVFGQATNAPFTLKYARYKLSNPNCASPSKPLAN